MILGPFSVLSNFYRVQGTTSPGHRLSFAVFSLIFGLGFVVIMWLIFRYLWERRGGRLFPLWLVLGAYVLIGILRGSNLAVASAIGMIPPQENLGYRYVQSIVVCVVWLSITAIVMDSIDRQRRRIETLEVRGIQLSMLRTAAHSRLTQTRAQVHLLITTNVVPVIEQLKAGIDRALRGGALPLAITQVAQQLRIALPQQLSAPADPVQPVLEFTPDRRQLLRSQLQLRELLRMTVTGVPFVPLANAPFMLFVFFWAGIDQASSATGFLVVLVMTAVNFVIISAIERWYPRVRGFVLQTAIWFGLLVVAGVVTSLPLLGAAAWWQTSISPAQAMVAVLLVQLWGGALIAFAKAARDRFKREEHSLRAANAAMEMEAQRFNSAAWSITRRADLVLQSVEERLQQSADQLEAAVNLPTRGGRGKALNEVWNILSSTELELVTITDANAEGKPLRGTLAVIAEKWRGIVDVTVYPIDDRMEVALAPLVSEISEIVREGISSAAKQGAATDVSVRIDVKEDSVRIIMVDNGTGSTGPIHATSTLGVTASRASDVNMTRAARGLTQLQVILPLEVA